MTIDHHHFTSTEPSNAYIVHRKPPCTTTDWPSGVSMLFLWDENRQLKTRIDVLTYHNYRLRKCIKQLAEQLNQLHKDTKAVYRSINEDENVRVRE